MFQAAEFYSECFLMIQVESRKLSSEECNSLAELVIAVGQGTELESEKSYEDIVEEIKKYSEHDAYRIYVAFNEFGAIVGWLNTYIGFPLMTFISGFEPIVHGERAEEIALALIEAAKEDVTKYERSRLEIELVFMKDSHRDLAKQLIDWYQKSDFAFAAEEAHMICDLTNVELPKLELVEGYTTRKFTDVQYEQLEVAGYETFLNGKDRLFLSMSHAEQNVTLKYFFDTSKPFIEEASIILERAGKIVGFIITRMRDDEIDIGPVGLIPEDRGKKLGTFLVVQALKNLIENGHSKVGLDMSRDNHTARKLYERYGFKDVYYKQFYYWSPQ